MRTFLKPASTAVITGLMTIAISCDDIKTKENMKEQNNISLFPRGEKLSGDWFSGDAYLSPLVAKDKNNEFSLGSVTFEPGARTNWHTHPKGQVLLVIEGNGLYQEKGKPARPIKKGDVVNIPENLEHWHGATASDKMVHIAITNFKQDLQVAWLQPVSEAEYIQANNTAN